MPRVIVIGAGPAGSVAAIVLARAQVDVTLIEQHSFPRDKTCGECISADGLELLDQLHLKDSLAELRPAVLKQCLIETSRNQSARLQLPRAMWGLSRSRFDSLLLDQARASGANILQPARAEGIDPGDSPRVRVRLLDSNEVRLFEADFVVQAEGKPRTHSPRQFGLKAHFENVRSETDAISLFGFHGHYGGLAPIEGGRWNIAIGLPAARLRHSRGRLDDVFAQLVEENQSLKECLRGASRASDWCVSPLDRFPVESNWPTRLIPVGNAACAIEPIGGEGMGLAMISAKLAADALVAALTNQAELDVDALRERYQTLWRSRRLGCALAGWMISSPIVSSLVVPWMNWREDLSGLAMRAMGKA